jgi:hypothetical protein
MTRPCARLAVLLTLIAAACTGNDEVVPRADASGPDADDLDAGVEPDGMPGVACSCFVVGADPANGVGTAAAIALPELTVQTQLVQGGISGDPVVRASGGGLFVINRFGADNVTIVDPVDHTFVDQFSTGAGSNPQDVARVTPGKLYVVVLGEPAVQIWDISGTPDQIGTIELPTLAADVDGNPDAASIEMLNGKAYVTLQHLESFAPAAPGEVVVIDPASDSVEDTITLTAANPTNFLRAHSSGQLLVGLTPDFGDVTAGCLERVVPGNPGTASCLVQGSTLGGLVNGFAEREDGSGELFVAAGDFASGKLLRVSETGVLLGDPLSLPGQQPLDVATCADWVIASDGAAGGIRVWDVVSGDELTTAALDIGLPPAFTGAIACRRR